MLHSKDATAGEDPAIDDRTALAAPVTKAPQEEKAGEAPAAAQQAAEAPPAPVKEKAADTQAKDEQAAKAPPAHHAPKKEKEATEGGISTVGTSAASSSSTQDLQAHFRDLWKPCLII